MENLKTIAPFEIFKDIAASIRTSQPISNITQTNGLTTLFLENTNNIDINNFVTINSGEIVGEYAVKEIYSNRIVINYSGAILTENFGTIETYPFFDWGNLREGKLEVMKRHEYPLIFMLLPNPFTINLDKKSHYYIENHTFKFIVINRYNEDLLSSEKTKTEYIYNYYVKQLAELSDIYASAIREHNLIDSESFSYKRSDEIPFGVTIGSNENGKSESVFEAKTAGCYIECNLSIKKQYLNCI